MALSARRSLLLLLAAIVSHDGLAATWAASARVRMLAPPAARALADGSGAARRAVVVRMMAGGAKSKGPKKAAVGKRGTKKGGEGFSKSPEAADAEQLAQFAEKAGAVAARVAAPAVAAAPRVQLFGGPFMRIELAVWQSLRLPREASNQAVLEALLAAVAEARLEPFVCANRDRFVKRFQLWMMAESLRRGAGGDAASAQLVRTALSQLILATRVFDFPLTRAVSAREQALNVAFESAGSRPEAEKPTITELAASEPLEQLGFWVVIASAKEAWLERLAESASSDRSLREAMERKVGQMDQFLEAIELTPEIQVAPVPVLLSAMRQNEVAADAVSDALIFELGCLVGCLENLRLQAFSALAQRVALLHDILVAGQPVPISLGAPLRLRSDILTAQSSGDLSAIIKYELDQSQKQLPKGESTVKLSSLIGIEQVKEEAARTSPLVP